MATDDDARGSVLDRRSLIKSGLALAGAGTLAALTPSAARAEELARATAATKAGVFGFGVASGDPTGTAVVLWTRVTPSPDAVPGSGRGAATTVTWELAADAAFRRVLRTGTVRTDAARDHTVHVDVTGLSPYTRYWYRFRALGATSPVGRTQTAPDDGRVHALRFGAASCANFTGGYFAAYRHLAQRDDLDFVLFLGDYLYEYGNGADRYGPEELAGTRDHVPAGEIESLADYRMRYGCYRADPDLQAAHARHPWILIFDDHEVADNSWSDGAVNHTASAEGSYAARRRRAYQAYLEWIPVRLPDQSVPHVGTRFWRRFTYGPLADLSCVESRQARDQQVSATGPQSAAQLADPDRHLLDPHALTWLRDGIASTQQAWHLVANAVVLAPVRLPALPTAPEALAMLGTTVVTDGGVVFNSDQWDGYQADQEALMGSLATSGGDVVVLTGDIHSSWANDLPRDAGTYAPAGPLNNSVGVEFVTPSVTSDGFAEILGGPQPAQAATTAFQAANRHIRYLDGVGHGYLVVDVTPQRVQTDFWHLSDRVDPRATQRLAASWQTVRGSRQLSEASAPIGRRSDSPRTLAVGAAPTRSPAPAPAPASAPSTGQLPSTGGGPALPVAAAALLAAAVFRRRTAGEGRIPS